MTDEPWSYADLDLTPPTIPPRSRLYPLAPLGVGTVLVESLTSYVARLAEAHGVWPKALVVREILPRFGRNYLTDLTGQNLAAFWQKNTYLVNGMQSWSCEWVAIVAALTQRSDLQTLTMLVWREVVSTGHLLRPMRAWCPDCYAAWAAAEQPLYDPLVWMLQAVTVCPLHGVPLAQRCPTCAHTMPVLAQRTWPGGCSHCGGWLGTQALARHAAAPGSDEDCWTARAIGQMVASTSAGMPIPPRTQVAMVLEHYVRQIRDGGIGALARRIGMSDTTLNNWRTGMKVPQLATLLRVCYRLDIAPVALLTDPPARVATHRLPSTVVEEPWHRCRKGGHGGASEGVRRALAEVVAQERQPPPSLREVAWHLGYTADYLRKRFPDLCQILTARHGRTRRAFDAGAIQVALEGVLAHPATPPPSLCAVARQLGYDHSRLRCHFPDLCRAIAAQYRAYWAARRQATSEVRCAQVRQIMQTLHDQGIYPSANRIGQQLANPHDLRRPEVQATWRAVLHELGWDA